MRTHLLLALPMAAVLCGCAVGPDYRVPDVDEARSLKTWPSREGAEAVMPQGLPSATWWRDFGDAQLDALIAQAWTDNRDLRIAMARLQIVTEQAQVAQSARWPAVGLDASASRERLSASDSPTGQAAIINPVRWSALFNWELDLFGRVRRNLEAAQASVDESAALRDDVRRVILAQLVAAYLDLRGAQWQSTCLQEQLDNQSKTLQLVRDRESAGSASAAERIRFEAQLSLVSSRLPTYRARERAARNRLATLTGWRLDAPQLLALERPVLLTLPDHVLTDEPAGLLRRRPDIRAAERALAAATAREGVATASLFPTVSMAALLGLSGTAGNWRGEEARTWRAGGNVAWSLFDAGALQAQVRAAGADVKAALATYEKAILTALEETDTALSDWRALQDRTLHLSTAYALAGESARLARIRYQDGAESLLGVLDAERTELSAREQLEGAKQDLAMAAARSYVAMAGGFDGGGKP